ncbi:hypothetical protein HZB88_04830 [archaeon]|nr:hypothetical protein [archaeon]
MALVKTLIEALVDVLETPTNRPTPHPTDYNVQGVRADLHVHTPHFSDSSLIRAHPREYLKTAKYRGMGNIGTVGHNHYGDAEAFVAEARKYEGSVEVFPGVELTLSFPPDASEVYGKAYGRKANIRGKFDSLALFRSVYEVKEFFRDEIEKRIPLSWQSPYYSPLKGDAFEILEKAKERDALMILAHPAGMAENGVANHIQTLMNGKNSLEEVPTEIRSFIERFKGIYHCIETKNGQNAWKRNQKSEALANMLKLPKFAGSDAHKSTNVGRTYTIIEGIEDPRDSFDALRKPEEWSVKTYCRGADADWKILGRVFSGVIPHLAYQLLFANPIKKLANNPHEIEVIRSLYS